ncbi:MAG: response regulator [Limisphaerales bacterium]
MKKILIIEDDKVLGNVCYNHLMSEGYHVKTAGDGETGLTTLRAFKPDLVLLDLILPHMSGMDVIKHIRSEVEFSKIPVVVFSNAYQTDVVQEAWKAGATKCVSKANCSPRELIEVVNRTIHDSIRDRNAVAPLGRPVAPPVVTSAAASAPLRAADDSTFQSDLRETFIASLPATLASLRASLQLIIKADSEKSRPEGIFELYRRVHALDGNAAVAGLVTIAQMAAALEALLKELYEKPGNINPSTVRTVASAVDFLGFLFQHGIQPGVQEVPAANILVVDDEEISRRAIIYSLEKAGLQSVNVESAETAYQLLTDTQFGLVFLDVDMPGMTGFELCAKLRALPAHKKTPVVFVTALNDFDSRTSSTMAGGNDFIAKPFLFIELTVKALIHVLRGKVAPVK